LEVVGKRGVSVLYKIADYRKGDFYVTTDPGRVDTEVVCSLLAMSYWAYSRRRDVILKSLENSLCFSLFEKDKQIGLARVVTDYSTFAYLCDVIIDEKYRHKGLGTWLMECIINHPDLQSLRLWCLITRDAHGLYRKFGFTGLTNPEGFMMRFNG
jgi:N-acetylglutamate synthase and related acetyltransferases